MERTGTSVAMMKVWIIPIVLLFIDATGCSAFDVSTIQVRETTEYSVDIELVDKAHNLFVSFVKCNGTQTYTTENRVVVDREKSLVKESFPDGNDRVWISNLIPNCNYKCVVVQKNYMDHRGLSLVKFSTKYADPLPPPAPEVTTETSNNQLVVTILLFPSSTKPSPISVYILQFYLVEVDADGRPLFSPEKPLELMPSLGRARSSNIPIDFVYQTYSAASLPDTVVVQPSVLFGAFKSNYTYSAVLTAYRNSSEGHEYDYATSKPSAAFKILYDSDDNNNNFRSKYARNVAGIVLGGVVPVLLCISAIALITMWCKYRKKKTTKLRYQKQYKKNKFNYPVFENRQSAFSIKSSQSRQYQPVKNTPPDQSVEEPHDRRPSVVDKGIDMLRRTSVTLAHAYKDFRNSLKRYSWVGEVEDLIITEEEKAIAGLTLTGSKEFLDTKEASVSNDLLDLDLEDPGKVKASVDTKGDAADSGDMQNISDSLDPERVMGNVIKLSSTPRSREASHDHLADFLKDQPQQDQLAEILIEPPEDPFQEVLKSFKELF